MISSKGIMRNDLLCSDLIFLAFLSIVCFPTFRFFSLSLFVILSSLCLVFNSFVFLFRLPRPFFALFSAVCVLLFLLPSCFCLSFFGSLSFLFRLARPFFALFFLPSALLFFCSLPVFVLAFLGLFLFFDV